MSLKTPSGTPIWHVLNTLPHYYDAVASGAKTFEIRRNDRGFQTGDVIELVRMRNETDRNAKSFDRSRIRKRITYMFAGDPALGLDLGGIRGGYVVLGLGDVDD